MYRSLLVQLIYLEFNVRTFDWLSLRLHRFDQGIYLRGIAEINLSKYDFEGDFLPKCVGNIFVYARQNARRAIYDVMKCHQFTVVIEVRDCAK